MENSKLKVKSNVQLEHSGLGSPNARNPSSKEVLAGYSFRGGKFHKKPVAIN